MKSIIRFYFMGEYKPTVIDSQVFSWLEYMPKGDIETIVISVLRKKQDGLQEVRIKNIEEQFEVQYREFRPIDFPGFRDIHTIIFVLYLYFSRVFHSRIVFQSRFLILWLTTFLFSWLPRCKFVYEARGSAITETSYSIGEDKTLLRRLKIITFREKIGVAHSHLVICVSDIMRNYFIDIFNITDVHRLIVIPGVSDSRVFYFSEDIRKEIRTKLNFLDNEMVFLYSGRLDKPWQQPATLFKLFSDLCKQKENTKFLILTPDIDIAEDYFVKEGIASTRYHIVHSPYKELNNYLNAADVGILLREDLPINNQASPTKFAEYVSSGLGVLISKNVGDFSGFVQTHEIGTVIDNDLYDAKEIIKDLSSIKLNRQEIAELGVKHLSKEAFSDLMISAITG